MSNPFTPKKKSRWKRLKQWLCGKIGHRLGSDRGLLLGARLVDRWCARCDKHIQIPLDEEDY